MKEILFILLGILSLSCNNERQMSKYDEATKAVLKLVLTEGIASLDIEDYLISPNFETNLNESDFKSMKGMLNVNEAEIEDMINNRKEHIQENITLFLESDHKSKISSDKPSSNQVYLIFDPPYFVEKYSKCIIYIVLIRKINDDFKWEDTVLLLNKGKNWKLEGHFSRG